ncbi:MAG: zinc ribbon domain-containing protein [Desulfovibrionaceae bacterium]|nr:zinc ribbon domain-containing protein [Desulfovibrionaceae bacterium]
MYCPKCHKPLPKDSSTCKYCGSRFVRQSDRMKRQMTINGRFAMACGGLMIFLALVLFVYGGSASAMQGVLLVLGLLFLYLGRKIT